jgi:hypothetical protein
MYINPFLAGAIFGCLIESAVIIALSFWAGRKKK